MLPETLSCGLTSWYVSYGDTDRPTIARTTWSAGVPVAVKENLYDSPATRVMSFWPTAASQRLAVPPGASAHSRPSVTAAVTLLLAHQDSVPLSKVPFLTCSVSSARPARRAAR